MSTSPLFEEIDSTIAHFLLTSGSGHGIRVHNRAKTDWLVFEWRQLTWQRDNMEVGIEIYPHFDANEQISSWTFYAFCSYDEKGCRHFLSKTFLEKVSLEVIVARLANLLPVAFAEIQAISHDDVPAVVALD